MLKLTIANHAQKAAAAVSIVCVLILLPSIGAVAVLSQWNDMDREQRIALDEFAKIRIETYQTLVELNKNFDATCSEIGLRKIRELLFKKRYIGDVGIFDENAHLVCTSIAGPLASSVAVPVPDAIVSAPNGEIMLFNVQTDKLLIAQPDVQTTIVRMGKFNVVINPLAMDGILATGISSLKHAFPNKLVTIWSSPKLPPSWKKKFELPEFVQASMHQFEWKSLTFVMVRRGVGETTLVQTIIPFNLFWRNYGVELITAWATGLLISVLTFYASKPVFMRWGKLKYRIEKFLTEENILCMYQPIIDLGTGRPIGCEVLMRLRVGNSVIFPDVAIPAIIERNLTWTLDQLVVRKAIKELAHKLPQLDEFKVAFNFFPNNMVSDKVCKLFEESLQLYPHSGLRFELEVLEQHYQDTMLLEMAKLRDAGFLLAVDDFGTGFSNLGSIKDISPDILKIDRSFVRDIEDESVRSSLVPEIVSIGRAVGAQIVAEGIENKQQMNILKAKGIEFGQGYYFARPQPIDVFAEYLNLQ